MGVMIGPHAVRYSGLMESLRPEQAHFLLHGVQLPALKNEHALTMRVIHAIPPDKGDYRPEPIAKSALELAWHIASSEMRFMDAVEAGKFDFTPNPRPDTIKNSADLAAWYSETFNKHLDAVSKLSNDQLLKVVDFRGIIQLPAVFYLNFLLHHSVHHRGQLSTYLRPMGAKVPAIYGESYDSAEARKASLQPA